MLNKTPNSFKIQIGIYGQVNSGKSSLINALTNHNTSIVSEQVGTTTDPVYKSMEILPLGPVLLIDTAGLKDESDLGKKRLEKTYNTLKRIDIALIVCGISGITEIEEKFIEELEKKKIKFLVVFNKSDVVKNTSNKYDFINVSALNNKNIEELKNKLKTFTIKKERFILKDLVNKKDVVILVTPIDSAAPKGRIILPQQQVLRELLDNFVTTIVVREFELKDALDALKEKPNLVITDSQAFDYVNDILPKDILLTSFSILFARFKGNLDQMLEGVNKLKTLDETSTILISEGCSHHRQDDDIGTVKIPNWIKKHINEKINIGFTHTKELMNQNLDSVDLIIMCGSCMLNRNEVMNNLEELKNRDIFVTNYGLFIAYITNILDRSIEVINLNK